MRIKQCQWALVAAAALGLGLGGCIGDASDDGEDPTLGEVEQDLSSPTNLTATQVSQQEIDLNWTAVAGATKYYIYAGTAPGNETYLTSVHPGTITNYQHTHLAAGSQHCYKITSGDPQSGFSNEACQSTVGAPAAPTNVVATAQTPTRINVTWDLVVGDTKYYILRSTNGGAFTYLTSSQTNSVQDATAVAGTAYCYEIEGVLPSGVQSNPSAPACTSTPTGGLEGYWKFNEQSGTTAKDSSGLARNGTILGAVYNTSTTDKPPLGDDPSSLTFLGGAASAVSVPTASAFDFSGDFSVAFWAKTSGSALFIGKQAAACGAATWAIKQDSALRLTSSTSSVSWGQALPAGTWTHVAVARAGTQTRLYLNGTRVATVTFTTGATNTSPLQIGNSGGCGGGAVQMDDVHIYSNALSDSDVQLLGQQPPAPTNVAATATSAFGISLSWTAVPSVSKYFVYRSTTSGAETFVATVTSGTTYADGHLTPGTQYFYTISDQRGSVVSPSSTEVSATTQPPPDPPQNVMAAASGSTGATLSWDAVAGATKYYVYMSTNGGAYAFNQTVIAPSTATTVRNLMTMTDYSFEIVVETANGDSQPSAPASITTP